MSFVLMTAYSIRNLDYLLNLSASGNKYKVILWNKKTNRCEFILTYDYLAEAQAVFDAMCTEWGMNIVEEVDTSDAYAYIASQHD